MNVQQSSLFVAALCGSLLAPTAQAQTRIGGQIRADAGRGAAACNETTMSVSPAAPLRIVGGWNDYRQGPPRCGIGLSFDGGQTWNDFLLRPPVPNQSGVEGDPMTCADPRTGTLWAGAMSFAGNGGVFVARLEPDKQTFEPVVMSLAAGGVDKGWMAAGPDPVDPANKTIVYASYNFGTQRSLDMGDSWTGTVSHGTGLGFLPRVGPDGTVYVTYWDVGNGVMLQRSTNGGASFGAPIRIATRMDVWGINGSRVPGNYRVASLNALAVDPGGDTVYCIYPDTTEMIGPNFNVDLYFCRSDDKGLTWSTPVVINDDGDPHGDQFFPWLEVDETGRLHLVFYDTRNRPQNDTDPQGWIEAYYSTSDDGGATWTEFVLTDEPFNSNLDGFGGGFIGDYNGLSSAGNRTTPLYMTTEPGNADAYTNIIRQGPATNYCMGILCPCGNDDPTAGCANSTGSGSSLSASGSDSVGSDDLVFQIDGAKPNTLGLLLMGSSKLATPFQDGRLCVAQDVFRFPPQVSNGSGSSTQGPGIVAFTQANFPPNGQIQPGQEWNFQAWSRDLQGPCGTGSNLSNASTVIFTP